MDLDASIRRAVGGEGPGSGVVVATDYPRRKGAVLLVQTDENGRCLLEWKGDPSPVFAVQASALYTTGSLQMPTVSSAEQQRLDDSRSDFRRKLSRVVPTARTRLASTAEDVEVDVSALQVRLHAALRFEPRNDSFLEPRAAERILEQIASTLRVYNDLLESRGASRAGGLQRRGWRGAERGCPFPVRRRQAWTCCTW